MRVWRVPVALIVLSAIPFAASIWRVIDVATGSPGPETERFFIAPIPILIHAISASLFAVLGAFQFSKGVRARWPRWHRLAGRVLAVAGIASALSGLWMTVAGLIPAHMQTPLLYVVRLIVGAAMAAGIGLAWKAALRRDFRTHEVWMLRAYALGVAAGTQAVVLAPWTLLVGVPSPLVKDVLMTAAWLLNIIVAEWLIARQAPVSAHAITGSVVK